MKLTFRNNRATRVLMLFYIVVFTTACIVPPMNTFVSEKRTSDQIKLGLTYTFIWNTGVQKGGYDLETGKKVPAIIEDDTIKDDDTPEEQIRKVKKLEERYGTDSVSESTKEGYREAIDYYEKGIYPASYKPGLSSKRLDLLLSRQILFYERELIPEPTVVNLFYEYVPNIKILAIELISITVFFFGLMFIFSGRAKNE